MREFKPRTTEEMAITVITPMTIPSTVSAERSLFLAIVSIAMLIVSRWSLLSILELGPQRHDGVQHSRLPGWIHTEENPYACRDEQRCRNRPKGDRGRHTNQKGHRLRNEDTAYCSNQSADQRHRPRLNKELAEHIASLGAEGLADADLARPLRHRNKHDVHDYDAAHDQRNRSDSNGHNEE